MTLNSEFLNHPHSSGDIETMKAKKKLHNPLKRKKTVKALLGNEKGLYRMYSKISLVYLTDVNELARCYALENKRILAGNGLADLTVLNSLDVELRHRLILFIRELTNNVLVQNNIGDYDKVVFLNLCIDYFCEMGRGDGRDAYAQTIKNFATGHIPDVFDNNRVGDREFFTGIIQSFLPFARLLGILHSMAQIVLYHEYALGIVPDLHTIAGETQSGRDRRDLSERELEILADLALVKARFESIVYAKDDDGTGKIDTTQQESETGE